MGNDTKLARQISAPADRAVLDPADILTPEELAARLKVRKSWVFERTRNRGRVRDKVPMPVIRMGGLVRFSWAQVSAWLLDQNKD